MKYALLALGLLLLLMGGYSVYTGAEIIDVERGWSSVIAGTTAVVGGVLAFGLAWIIRNLEQLRAAIETREMSASAKSTMPAAHEAFMNAPDDLPIAPLSSPLSSPLSWPPHTTAAAAPATRDDAFDELALSHAEPTPCEEAFEEEVYDPFPSVIAEQPQASLERPAAAERTKASPSIKELWQRVAREIDATGTAAPFGRRNEPPVEMPPIGAEAPAPAASMSAPAAAAGAPLAAEEAAEDGGDWLDHALADLDSVIAQTPSLAPPAGAPRGAHLEAAEPEQQWNELLTDEHMEEAAPPLAPEPAPAGLPFEPAEAPAVIGRYQAEGTCYIMFADGSIEAQSERGVAHFNSMADLKAYFETQEAP